MKKFMNGNKKVLTAGITCILFFLIILVWTFNIGSSRGNISFGNVVLNGPKMKNYVYLSDLNYITDNNWSYNGWSGHNIQMDRNQDGGALGLIVNGESRSFSKGFSVHARGQITFDISAYSSEYTRFVAYMGVDASRGTNGSVWFQIFLSKDGVNWESRLKTDVMNGTTPAVDVDIDVEGYKYLRIYVDPDGSNAADHGTIGKAKLVPADYDKNAEYYSNLKNLDYYDNILREHDVEYNYSNNYKVILEREIVNKLGYWNIQDVAEFRDGVDEVLDWILSDNRRAEYVVEVGEISNTALFLEVMANIYKNNKAIFDTSNGYVYEKMMVGLAAAYSTDRVISPLAFSFQSPTTYDYLERFQIMKDLFDNNQFRRVNVNALAGNFVTNDWFKDYHVQLMRMVMQDGTSNIDLKWLNGFTNEKQSVSFYMIGYVSPVYTQDKFYAEENREKYDQQFYLSKYNVPYGLVNGTKIARYWMVFANGGICWNASRVGQSMYRVNGIPATGAYQPGHELYIQYYQDNNGNGYWTPRYGNWGWAGSTWGGGNPYRYIFNWGNKYFADKHISGGKGASSTGYLYLGQANLNRLEQYQKSLYYNLAVNSYTDNNQKLAGLQKALEINEINLDTYDNIITLYKAMSNQNEGGTITSHDWYVLANKIIEAYRFYPVAMFDLLKVIRPYLEGSERMHIDRLEKETLQRAARATAADTLQGDGVRTHANQLLNQAQPDPMTFSFDGDNAGKIIKNSIYQLAWGYSLDGGNTWAKFNNNGTETEFTDADEIALSPEEIASITPDNDIIFKFMGLKDFTFRIDITKGTLSSLLFANDLENRVIGIDLTYEWRNSESDSWTSYRTSSPDNTGNKTLYVRRGNTGIQLASDSVAYTFTDDNQPNTRKYVPISHLSIAEVSTEATNNAGAATYAIDGNYNTRWHSAWNGSDTRRFITIELDKPRYVSAVEFVPAGGGNGKIYDGTIYGCNKQTVVLCNTENSWEILARRTNITYSNAANDNEQAIANTKSFDIDDPKEVRFVKIVADRTNGNWFTAREFNIFQDLTSNERPTAGVGYSTTEPTAENVVARLVNVSVTNYEILSPGGDTHTFTENGEFTFRFRDKDTGLEGSSKAVVNWIDRVAPTATIEYSTLNSVNSSVFAILKPSEKIRVLNNGYYSIDEEEKKVYDKDGNLLTDLTVDDEGVVKDSGGKVIDPLKYEFIDNGEFTFEFVDMAGNRGTAMAKVDWIDFDAPIPTLAYSKNTLTNEDVTVIISFNEEAQVVNNNSSTTYTFTENGSFEFEFRDNAGNVGKITANVNWIDKEAPTATLEYERQNGKVIVKVVNASEEIGYAEGIGVYEFTSNGKYPIVIRDKAGNETTLMAEITGLNGGSGDKPTTPDKPTNPDDNKPDNPGDDKPTNPDNNKPDKPNDNNPSDNNPGNSGDSNSNGKPGNNNQGGTTNKPGNNGNSGSNNSNPGENTGEPINPINKDYKEYSFKNVKVDIPSNLIKEGMDLYIKEFSIPKEMEQMFGDASEYYDVMFATPTGEKLELGSESPLKVTIKLKSNKEFIGVYEITSDNTIKPIDYNKNGQNVEITTKNLGRYVVSYKGLKAISPSVTLPVVNDENKDVAILPWVIGAFAVISLGVFIYIVEKDKENN